jgi:hypothetical protein
MARRSISTAASQFSIASSGISLDGFIDQYGVRPQSDA